MSDIADATNRTYWSLYSYCRKHGIAVRDLSLLEIAELIADLNGWDRKCESQESNLT